MRSSSTKKFRRAWVAAVTLTGFAATVLRFAHAEIYRWDNGQLIPGTTGVFPAPGADLSSLTLDYANLNSAALQSASLTAADLDFAQLMSANLNIGRSDVSARLLSASVISANLTGAIVLGTQLSSVTGFATAQLYSTASYQTHHLAGIGLQFDNLATWNFTSQDLASANLNSANLYGASLTSSELTSANLTLADLNSARLDFADLSSAILVQANFDVANLTSANFSGANIRRANLAHVPTFTALQLYSTASYRQHDLNHLSLSYDQLQAWDFSRQNLTAASLGASNLASATFLSANLATASLDAGNFTGASFVSTDMTSAQLASAILTSADFTGAIVRGAQFTGATGFTAQQLYSTASYKVHDLTGIRLSNDLTAWDFSQQNLTSAVLASGTVASANFTGAILRGARVLATAFTAAQLYSTASYQAHDLAGIGLSNAVGWDLSSQNLTSAFLFSANLASANLTSANLTSANLSASNLTSANLTGAILRGASFRGPAPFGGTVGLTAAQVYTTASYQSHDLTGVGLSYADLRNWNFTSQNLSSVDFYSANLGSATLTAAHVTGAYFYDALGFTPAQLYSTASYQNHDLTGIGLSNAVGWSFTDQNLTSAEFTQANLSSAIFYGADLTSANLSLATVTSAYFINATIRNANFSNVTGFTRAQLYSTQSYQDYDLRGVVLQSFLNNQPMPWDFSSQNLATAILSMGDFASADFTSANLTSVNLTSANLTSANLTSSNLTFADLRVTVGFSPAASTILRGAILPDGSVYPFDLNTGETFQVNEIFDVQPANLLGPIHIAPGSSLSLSGPVNSAVPLVIPDNTTIQVFGTLKVAGPVAITLNGGILGGGGNIIGAVNAGSGLHTIGPSLSTPFAGTLTMSSLSTNSNTTLAFNLKSLATHDALNITDHDGLLLDGGAIQITNVPSDASSLGYYSVLQYSGNIQGAGPGSLILPAVQHNIAYTLDLTRDPGFIDLHRGFLGDANDDGAVNFDDFLTLSQNFGKAGGWAQANFLSDPTIDFNDFLILSQHFGQSIDSTGLAASSAEIAAFENASQDFPPGSHAPEPATLALLAPAVFFFIRRRGGNAKM